MVFTVKVVINLLDVFFLHCGHFLSGFLALVRSTDLGGSCRKFFLRRAKTFDDLINALSFFLNRSLVDLAHFSRNMLGNWF